MLVIIHWTINVICLSMAILGFWAIEHGNNRIANICVLSFPIYIFNLIFLATL